MAVVHFAAVKSVIHSFAPLEFPSLLVDPHSSFATTRLCALSSVPSSILISFHYLLEYFNLLFFSFSQFVSKNEGCGKETWNIDFFVCNVSNRLIMNFFLFRLLLLIVVFFNRAFHNNFIARRTRLLKAK